MAITGPGDATLMWANITSFLLFGLWMHSPHTFTSFYTVRTDFVKGFHQEACLQPAVSLPKNLENSWTNKISLYETENDLTSVNRVVGILSHYCFPFHNQKSHRVKAIWPRSVVTDVWQQTGGLSVCVLKDLHCRRMGKPVLVRTILQFTSCLFSK